MDYGFEHNGSVYTPDRTVGIVPSENAARNAAIERAELAHWATQPAGLFAYYRFPGEEGGQPYRPAFRPSLDGATVGTWLGSPLGVITRAQVYRHNFGGRMVAITVKGNNGAVYHGRASWDGGQCVRLRKGR